MAVNIQIMSSFCEHTHTHIYMYCLTQKQNDSSAKTTSSDLVLISNEEVVHEIFV